MNLLLNSDIVALAPPTLARGLMALIQNLANDRIGVAKADWLKLKDMFVAGTWPSLDVERYMWLHFQISGHSSQPSPWVIDSPATAIHCCADGLVAGSLTSSISVGAKNTTYGNLPEFVLRDNLNPARGRKSALMVSEVSHLSRCDVQRWFFVKHFNDYWPNPTKVGVKFVDQHGHCVHGNERACVDAQWTGADWVAATRSRGISAKFRPGIYFGSEKYARLVAHVLRTAYENMYFAQAQQDQYVVDVGVYVGASNGKPTKNVEIYITPQNEIHIRPSEQPPCAKKKFLFPLDR